MGRTDAVTPMMTLAQPLDLLFVEFHVCLVPERSFESCLLLLLYIVEDEKVILADHLGEQATFGHRRKLGKYKSAEPD